MDQYEETEICQKDTDVPPCPIDCVVADQWTLVDPSATCSTTCGADGVVEQERKTLVAPQFENALECPAEEDLKRSVKCNSPNSLLPEQTDPETNDVIPYNLPCPIDCVLHEWADDIYHTCDQKTCWTAAEQEARTAGENSTNSTSSSSQLTKHQHRAIKVNGQFGGVECPAADSEERERIVDCDLDHLPTCPIDCVLSNWHDEPNAVCSATCGPTGRYRRVREILVQPQGELAKTCLEVAPTTTSTSSTSAEVVVPTPSPGGSSSTTGNPLFPTPSPSPSGGGIPVFPNPTPGGGGFPVIPTPGPASTLFPGQPVTTPPPFTWAPAFPVVTTQAPGGGIPQPEAPPVRTTPPANTWTPVETLSTFPPIPQPEGPPPVNTPAPFTWTPSFLQLEALMSRRDDPAASTVWLEELVPCNTEIQCETDVDGGGGLTISPTPDQTNGTTSGGGDDDAGGTNTSQTPLSNSATKGPEAQQQQVSEIVFSNDTRGLEEGGEEEGTEDESNTALDADDTECNPVLILVALLVIGLLALAGVYFMFKEFFFPSSSSPTAAPSNASPRSSGQDAQKKNKKRLPGRQEKAANLQAESLLAGQTAVPEKALLSAGFSPGYAKKAAKQIAKADELPKDATLSKPDSDADRKLLKKLHKKINKQKIKDAEEAGEEEVEISKTPTISEVKHYLAEKVKEQLGQDFLLEATEKVEKLDVATMEKMLLSQGFSPGTAKKLAPIIQEKMVVKEKDKVEKPRSSAALAEGVPEEAGAVAGEHEVVVAPLFTPAEIASLQLEGQDKALFEQNFGIDTVNPESFGQLEGASDKLAFFLEEKLGSKYKEISDGNTDEMLHDMEKVFTDAGFSDAVAHHLAEKAKEDLLHSAVSIGKNIDLGKVDRSDEILLLTKTEMKQIEAVTGRNSWAQKDGVEAEHRDTLEANFKLLEEHFLFDDAQEELAMERTSTASPVLDSKNSSAQNKLNSSASGQHQQHPSDVRTLIAQDLREKYNAMDPDTQKSQMTPENIRADIADALVTKVGFSKNFVEKANLAEKLEQKLHTDLVTKSGEKMSKMLASDFDDMWDHDQDDLNMHIYQSVKEKPAEVRNLIAEELKEKYSTLDPETQKLQMTPENIRADIETALVTKLGFSKNFVKKAKIAEKMEQKMNTDLLVTTKDGQPQRTSQMFAPDFDDLWDHDELNMHIYQTGGKKSPEQQPGSSGTTKSELSPGSGAADAQPLLGAETIGGETSFGKVETLNVIQGFTMMKPLKITAQDLEGRNWTEKDKKLLQKNFLKKTKMVHDMEKKMHEKAMDKVREKLTINLQDDFEGEAEADDFDEGESDLSSAEESEQSDAPVEIAVDSEGGESSAAEPLLGSNNSVEKKKKKKDKLLKKNKKAAGDHPKKKKKIGDSSASAENKSAAHEEADNAAVGEEAEQVVTIEAASLPGEKTAGVSDMYDEMFDDQSSAPLPDSRTTDPQPASLSAEQLHQAFEAEARQALESIGFQKATATKIAKQLVATGADLGVDKMELGEAEIITATQGFQKVAGNKKKNIKIENLQDLATELISCRPEIFVKSLSPTSFAAFEHDKQAGTVMSILQSCMLQSGLHGGAGLSDGMTAYEAPAPAETAAEKKKRIKNQVAAQKVKAGQQEKSANEEESSVASSTKSTKSKTKSGTSKSGKTTKTKTASSAKSKTKTKTGSKK
ncbi:unnamed protein product [Amoebophrya sp. A120]|nr:unnamed protein product [Amoebophrya sp. A120]|eukprot:GSA120T00013472001.1